MKALPWAAAVICVAHGVLLWPLRHRCLGETTRVPLTACAVHVAGGPRGSAYRFQFPLARFQMARAVGQGESGLRALGFSERDIALSRLDFALPPRLPEPRIAWVRLRQLPEGLYPFMVEEISPLRRRLTPDSTSLVVKAQVGLTWRLAPTPDELFRERMALREGRPPERVRVRFAVIALVPPSVRMKTEGALNVLAAQAKGGSCVAPRTVEMGNDAAGGVWVRGVR